MDTAHGIEQEARFADEPAAGGVGEATSEIGGDERRMHVRAYNHWVSLLHGRSYPALDDLAPGDIGDFGTHSVLLDFSGGIDDPAIRFLGTALREECALDHAITHISQVPARSLLSRLTDHYLQIIANRAPIGFEAEFVGTRGHQTLYRGILMPISSDEETIDYIYGVINWKELVDADTQAVLSAELDAAINTAPRHADVPAEPAPVWADGPRADYAPRPTVAATPLDDQLALARESAAAMRAADVRSRAALYRALGRAHDFGLAADADAAAYATLLDGAGITVQARAPMTPLVKLVFGADYDKTRLTEFAAVLAHARRHDIPAGALNGFLDAQPGGIKGIVAAERAARRPAAAPAPTATAAVKTRRAIAHVALDTGAAPGEVVVLVARACAGGIEIVGHVTGNEGLAGRAVRALD